MGRPTAEEAEASSRLASILVVDLVAFGRLSTVEQSVLRSEMYEILHEALDSAGVPVDECHREDRGDGALVIAPARFGGEVLLGRQPEQLRAGIEACNAHAASSANLRLRAAGGRGQVILDQHGVLGNVVNSVFRMVGAAPVRAAARDRGADLVLVASGALFREAKASVDVGDFEEVAVRVKETNTTAWMRVYGGHPPVAVQGVVHGDVRYFTSTVGPRLPVPFQLPAPTPDFVGRERALAELDAALARVKVGRFVSVLFVGMAGVGLSVLALRWAHQVRDRFADGQLWADLGGAAPDSEAVDPAEILADFLLALGTAKENIPEGVDARARLYRTMLHRKRELVVLDSAH